MNAYLRHFGWLSLASIALVGCDAPVAGPDRTAPTPPPSSTAPGEKNDIKSMPVDPAKPDEAKDKDKAALTKPAKLSDEEIAEIKKLPADEQPIALAQMVCPVGEGHLGEMGMPLKQVVEGKTVFLCCAGCEEKLKKDPATYLAKLKK